MSEPPPTNAELRRMGLFVDANPPRQSVKNIKLFYYDQRKALHDKLKATDYLGKIANDKSVTFAIERGTQLALKYNFQVVVLTSKARIPASGANEAVNLPEESYLFTTLQAKWSKKYLTA